MTTRKTDTDRVLTRAELPAPDAGKKWVMTIFGKWVQIAVDTPFPIFSYQPIGGLSWIVEALVVLV